MMKVGLTGNIGSGKTTVSQVFRSLGIPVFHADIEAKKLYLLPEVRESLQGITGPGILADDGTVDRKKMAELLFNNEELLKKVNDYIHPLVREAFSKQLEELEHQPYAIYEAAILIESGHYHDMDKIILVRAPEELRIKRVIKRDGVNEEDVRIRIRNQMPEGQKVPKADFIIHNDDREMIIPQVLEIDRALRDATKM